MKKLLSIVLAALVLLPVSCCKKDTLRVMSFNIRLGVVDDGENSWDNRKSAIPAMLDTVRPDIVGMQEVYPFQ
ncbi:MAG: endonuclease, partial [Bacteroidales bacterium]|nr:endonuclease [Bacteroidales bacterium]